MWQFNPHLFSLIRDSPLLKEYANTDSFMKVVSLLVALLYCSSVQGGNCTVSQTSLTCTAPMFNTTELLANISYTVRVGNAPGPDLTNSPLTLDVQPNPVFAEDGTAIVNREHAIGEEFLLTIIVSQQ